MHHPTIHFVLPHPNPNQRRALLLKDAETGAVRLPTAPLYGWFPNVAPPGARLVAEQVGIPCIALRHLTVGDQNICVLENLSQDDTVPEGAIWWGADQWAEANFAEECHHAALQAWVADIESNKRAPDTLPRRQAWEASGWFAMASDWMRVRLQEYGLDTTGPVLQVKAGWPGSCILSVTAGPDNRRYFLKADHPKPPSEPLLVQALAERFPGEVPTLIAVHAERNWMLMEAFPDDEPDTQDQALMESLFRRLGAIQHTCVDDVTLWRTLGCADFGPETFAGQLETLLADLEANGEAEEYGLGPAELAALRTNVLGVVARIASRLQELSDIPVTLVQMDFRPGNVVVTGPDLFLFYDWSESVLTHPFFAPARFLLDEDNFPPSTHPALIDAYLDGWAGTMPLTDSSRDRLRASYALVSQIFAVYHLLRFYRESLWYAPEDVHRQVIQTDIRLPLSYLSTWAAPLQHDITALENTPLDQGSGLLAWARRPPTQ